MIINEISGNRPRPPADYDISNFLRSSKFVYTHLYRKQHENCGQVRLIDWLIDWLIEAVNLEPRFGEDDFVGAQFNLSLIKEMFGCPMFACLVSNHLLVWSYFRLHPRRGLHCLFVFLLCEWFWLCSLWFFSPQVFLLLQPAYIIHMGVNQWGTGNMSPHLWGTSYGLSPPPFSKPA